MFSDFLSYFNKKENVIYSGDLYNDFLLQLGGMSFGDGIFRSFSHENLKKWELIVAEAYPESKNMFKLFGYDWLGRCFGIDLRENAKGNVLMFEIGTNEILEIPCQFNTFLNEEIPLYADACLAKAFFDEWNTYTKQTIKYGRCASYKTPLFLGGEDKVTNLEDSDMEVYWNIITQIKTKL